MTRVDASGHDASHACANCGAELTGPFCAACGQHGHVHRTVGAFLHDVLHGVFHFEGKFWATLPMLAWRPGELTRRYVAGERAKFVSPVAVFLFSVFLMFAIVANIPFLGSASELGTTPQVAQLRGRLAEQRAASEKEVRKAERSVARARQGEDAAEARAELATAREDLARIAGAQRFLPPPDGRAAAKSGDTGTDTGGDVGRWVQAKIDHARENPQLVAYKIKTSAYKYSWALIPLSLPFIWLLFPFRRDVGMYDHAVFATYSLSFMSLAVVVLTLLRLVGLSGGLTELAMVVIVPWHIYRQLKGAYGLSRAGALWRTGWMLLFAAMASGLFVSMLTYMGTK
jgi:hypothetical protein